MELEMKITCVLTSFNRPNLVKHALKSVADQTHQDIELLVFDDSSAFDIRPVVEEFKFKNVRVFHEDLTPERRKTENRLSINCNRGLKEATGDVLTFLCCDDYYHPTWFENAARFFTENPDKSVCFGILTYTRNNLEMVFPEGGERRWFNHVVKKPKCTLDHNQVMHRRFDPPFQWPLEMGTLRFPDAFYFEKIADAGHDFYPVNADAVVKRHHNKNLQNTFNDLGRPEGELIRE